jgi:hypothetical protein
MTDFEKLIAHKAGKPVAILDSQKVIVMHGHESGALPALNDSRVLEAIEKGFKIACCYPHQVRARYGLDVIGDWLTKSEVYFVDQNGNIATSSDKAVKFVVKSA